MAAQSPAAVTPRNTAPAFKTIDAATEHVRRALFNIIAKLGVLHSTLTAFKVAAERQEEGTRLDLTWSSLLEVIGMLIPDEGGFDDVIFGAVESFKTALTEATGEAAAVSPELLALVIRAANGMNLGHEHVRQLAAAAEQLAALAAVHPGYVGAYEAYAAAMERCGWDTNVVTKHGRVTMEFSSKGLRAYDQTPPMDAMLPRTARKAARSKAAVV
jgi:hypothetical protein